MLSEKIKCDLVIFGAGTTGSIATIKALRLGLDTVLVEKTDLLGGTIVNSLIYPMMSFHSPNKLQIIHGIAQELIAQAIKNKASFGHLPDPLGFCPTITPIENNFIKIFIEQELNRYKNLKLFLKTDTLNIKQKDGLITEIKCQKASKEIVILPKFVIDCTGDANIANMLKIPFWQSKNCQPMTLIFKIKGIEKEAIKQSIKKNKADFVLSKDFFKNDFLALSGFFSKVKEAQKKENIIKFRDRVLLFEGSKKDEAFVNMTRVANLDGTLERDKVLAYQIAEKQIAECLYFFKNYLSGFEKVFLAEKANWIGVRETRRIKGLYQLKNSDVLNNKKFDNSVASCAFPIDLHLSSNKLSSKKINDFYQIPYQCLLVKEVKNLMVAGRAISSQRLANASLRVSPVCMAMGESAAKAIYLAMQKKLELKEVML